MESTSPVWFERGNAAACEFVFKIVKVPDNGRAPLKLAIEYLFNMPRLQLN